MSVSLKDTMNNLALRMVAGTRQDKITDTFITALFNGDFKFERETWHDLAACELGRPYSVAGEMLIRARDKQGQDIPPEHPVKTLYAQSSSVQKAFDTFIFLAAMKQTIETCAVPVSINVSSRNVRSENFWHGIGKFFDHFFGHQFKPQDVIFELLEDDDGHDAKLSILRFIRDRGFRLALDDVTNDAFGHKRLRNLGAQMDFIKIAGHVVERAYQNEAGRANYIDLLERIEADAPQAQIIFENIKSATMAGSLRDAFQKEKIVLVQGRYLDEKRFNAEAHYASTMVGPRRRYG